MNRDLLHTSAPTDAELRQAKQWALRGEYSRPFLIIGASSAFFPDEGIAQWQIVITPAQRNDQGVIDQPTAERIIAINKMHKVAGYEYGRVFESEGEPFRAMWRGWYTTHDLMRIWPDLMGTFGAPRAAMSNPDIFAWGDDHNLELYVPDAVEIFLRRLTDPINDDPRAASFRRFVNNRNIRYFKI